MEAFDHIKLVFRDLMYMYDLIDVKEYTDTEFDQDQGSPHYFNCRVGECLDP